jgi:hypothetical protein
MVRAWLLFGALFLAALWLGSRSIDAPPPAPERLEPPVRGRSVDDEAPVRRSHQSARASAALETETPAPPGPSVEAQAIASAIDEKLFGAEEPSASAVEAALDHPLPEVRAQVLHQWTVRDHSLPRARLEQLALSDPDPGVREEALAAISRAAPNAASWAEQIAQLAVSDPSAAVSSAAIALLDQLEAQQRPEQRAPVELDPERAAIPSH